MKVKDISVLAAHMERIGLANPDIVEKLFDLEGGEGFNGHVVARQQEDRLNCNYQISKDIGSDMFRIEGYRAVLLSIDNITHDVFEGIDSFALETRLKELDIFRDWKTVFDRHSPIAQVCTDLMLLAKSDIDQAKEISGLLSLKYFSDTPIENLLEICVDRERYEKEIFIPLNGDEHDIGILQAYNLLSGRSLMKLKETPEGFPPQAYWLMVEEGHLKILPEFDIVGALLNLPIVGIRDRDLIQDLFLQLVNGDKVVVDVLINGESVQGYIVAYPVEGSLTLHDQSGKPILATRPRLDNHKGHHNEEKTQGYKNGNIRPGKKRGPSL